MPYFQEDFGNYTIWLWYNQIANGVKEIDESKFSNTHDIYYIVQDF